MDGYGDVAEVAPVRPDTSDVLSRECLARAATLKVAVVGGGLGGLMAARTLARWGAKVTVYEARAKVGGRVLSDTTFAKGQIIEAGAELVGSIHTRWCALAKEYGLSLISRMDVDLYRGQQLRQRMILERRLTPDEADAIEKEREDKVLRRLATFARDTIPAGTEAAPWTRTGLRKWDDMSVATALKNEFGVQPGSRLWLATELLLVNNNVAPLDKTSFLALLCLVRGGQTARPASAGISEDRRLMSYWNELEIYRSGEGCQRLAQEIAAEVRARGGEVLRDLGVRRIELRPGSGVTVTARSTRDTTFDRWLRDKVPGNPLMQARPYHAVVLAVPPQVWSDIEIVPTHPKDVIGALGWGPAVKFFSRVTGRFWIRDGAAPLGGSLQIGQVWEGTDNQTRARGQQAVLNVFTGARTPTERDYLKGLADLYPATPGRKDSGYAANRVGKPLLVDWSRQPFIRTGYSSPRKGQVFDVVKELNEPFEGRLFFAGEHTRPDHFGYMEGAIRSGEQAARMLVDRFCGSQVLVAAAG